MKKIIIIAIMLIAQNQLMAQAKKDVTPDADAILIAKIQKANKAKMVADEQEPSNEVQSEPSRDFSYIVEVPKELKHKNKKPLDNNSATGAPVSTTNVTPVNDNSKDNEYGKHPFTEDYDKLKD